MSPPWHWSDRWRDVHVRFTGKGAAGRGAAGRGAAPQAPEPHLEAAWLEQIHSAAVLETSVSGCRGRGDALLTERSELALLVVTADCVPVLLADRTRIAAIHAGWRGVAAKIVPAAAEKLAGGPSVAWIGPAISGQAYEVGSEVADQVASVSGDQVVLPGPGGRPHVDLQLAVELQLRRLGIEDVRRLGECTFLRSDILWSYRRDGAEAGRNRAWVWRSNR